MVRPVTLLQSSEDGPVQITDLSVFSSKSGSTAGGREELVSEKYQTINIHLPRHNYLSSGPVWVFTVCSVASLVTKRGGGGDVVVCMATLTGVTEQAAQTDSYYGRSVVGPK